MSCPHCGSDARPNLAMGANMQLVEACSACGRPFGRSFSDPLLQTVEVTPEPPAVPRSAPKPSQPQDILTLARSRLAQLETELQALAAKQTEADMLRRMIAAAEPPN